MMRGRLTAAALACAVMSAPLTLIAQKADTSYFQNLGLTPVGTASRSLITQEPAAVLVFSGSAGSADATALFNTWVNKTTRDFRGAAFGVAYKPAGQAKEIIEEVLSQRDIQFPVFLTETDLLGGRDYRLMVVAGGQAHDVPGLDFAALDAELARHSGEGRSGPEATSTPDASQDREARADATPAPEGEDGAPPAAPTPAPVGQGLYYNTYYGFTIEFPQGWTYRVARNNDGAVGRAPAGRNVDLRAWAVPASQVPGAEANAAPMSIPEYIEEHLNLLAEQTGSRVSIIQRYRVDDEGIRGYDYTYNFSRAMDAQGIPRPAGQGPMVLHRGRLQVFETNGVFKVASAEAPAGEFERSGPVIEEFIQSFHPFIADAQGNPVATPPAGARPVQPGGASDPGPGARPVY